MSNLTELAITSTPILYRISLTLSSKNMKKIIIVPKVVGEADFIAGKRPEPHNGGIHDMGGNFFVAVHL